MSQARIAGAIVRYISLGGKTYTLHPHTVGAYAELEAFFLSMRTPPLVAVASRLPQIPPSQHPTVLDAAMRAEANFLIVSAQEISEFENSVWGQAHKIYCSLRKNHPEIKGPKEALALLESLNNRDAALLLSAVKSINEEDLLKNSVGPEEKAPGEDGPPSTAISPSNTSGPPPL